MASSVKRDDPALEDAEDDLRSLMSAMLSDDYQEQLYLWDVAALCRAQPTRAPKLQALVDRYYRLGRMPEAQYRKVSGKIKQVLAALEAADAQRDGAGQMPHPAAPPQPQSRFDVDDSLAAPGDAVTRDLPEQPPRSAASTSAVPEPPVATAAPMNETGERVPSAAGRTASAPSSAATLSAAEAPPANPAPAASPPAPTRASVPESSRASEAASAPRPAESAPQRSLTAEIIARMAAESHAQHSVGPASAASLPSSALSEPARPAPTAATAPAPAPVTPSTSAASGTAAPAPIPAAAVPPSIGPGTTLDGRYELQVLLGHGGMGSVYKALDRYRVSMGLDDSHVALKLVIASQSRPAAVTALAREFHNTQRLSHPNVVNVYDIGHEGELSFYTMELLDGHRLSQVLKRLGRLPRRFALAILRDVGSAIAHAHSRGIMHADLKPHNIMITRDGEVRVTDFGSVNSTPREPWISELSEDDTPRHATPSYASCEQLEGWPPEPRDDIYALACITYELLAGRHPFDYRSAVEARGNRLHARRPAQLSAHAWRALRQGLAFSRDQRPSNLEQWLWQLGIEDAAPSLPLLSQLSAARPPRVWVRRTAAAAAVVIGLSLCVLAFQMQPGLNWRQTLASAQERVSDVWQQVKSLGGGQGDAPSAPADAAAIDNTTPAPEPAVSPPPPPAPSLALTPVPRAAARGTPLPTKPILSAANSSAVSPAVMPVAAVSSVAAAKSAASGVAFVSSNFSVPAGDPAARIVVRRLGNTDNELTFVWWTKQDSAKPDVDYASLGRRVERIPSGQDKITVYVPIISSSLRTDPTQFYVELAQQGTEETPSAQATVTINRGG